MLSRYMYLNDDSVHDWTLYQAALKATNEITYYVRNRLTRHRDGAVCFALYRNNEHRVTSSLQQICLEGASDMLVTSLITSNVQNDRFIANILASVQHSTIRAIAYNIFAETVPSALLFSAAISSVVDYYADPSRREDLERLVQLSTIITEGGPNGALMKLIDDALSKSLATSHLILKPNRK